MEDFMRNYNEWLECQTEEESKLQIRIMMLEQYFDDCCFEKGTSTGDYMMRDGKKYNFADGLSIDEQYFCIKIRDTEKDMPAYIDTNKREIVISPLYKNDDSVILHEMIHAHEFILNQCKPLLREIILIELYKSLKQKFADVGASIDVLIYNHANIPHNIELANEGGEHGLLFFLKSIDLDIKLGYDILTVFGYDYKRAFAEIDISK